MKYPYISTTMNNLLFYAKDTASSIGDESNQFSSGFKLTVDESGCENNTHEYLPNTWGVVESKEHAEFIIELAELHGFEIFGLANMRAPKSFKFRKGRLFILDQDAQNTDGLNKITIPLPPKQEDDRIEKSREMFKPLGDEMKKLQADLLMANEDEDKWPQVGDEVLTSDELGVIKSTPDSKGFYAVLIDGEYSLLHLTEFEKPKSKQDLLIEELQTKLCNNNAVDNYILACDIVQGKIDGLSYTG